MKQIALAFCIMLSAFSMSAQKKDTTTKAPVTVVAPADSVFDRIMNEVFAAFDDAIAKRLSTTQWKAVLGEMNQSLYSNTTSDLKQLLIQAMQEWRKRKPAEANKPKQ